MDKNFKVGDKVRVARKDSKCWVGKMDDTIGSTGEVVGITDAGNLRVRLSDGDWWYYPPETLEKVRQYVFKVGDKVRVTGRGGGCWVDSMDVTVGYIGEVREVTRDGNVEVRLSDGDTWFYPPDTLEKVNSFEVGDKVKVKCKVGLDWLRAMDATVGRTGKVTQINTTYESPYHVQFPDGKSWWYVADALERVSEEFTFSIEPSLYSGDYELVVTPSLHPSLIDDPLPLSIRKWYNVWRWLTDHPGQMLYDNGTKTCALCTVHDPRNGCKGCPIRLLTGQSECRGTPYPLYVDGGSCSAAVAEAEYHFLRALQGREAQEGLTEEAPSWEGIGVGSEVYGFYSVSLIDQTRQVFMDGIKRIYHVRDWGWYNLSELKSKFHLVKDER